MATKRTLWRSPVPGGSRAVKPRKKTGDLLAALRARTPGQVVPLTNPSKLRTPKKATVPAPGVVPGSTVRVPARARRAPTLAPKVPFPAAPRAAGPPAPRGKRPDHTLRGPLTPTPYHTPRPTPTSTASPRKGTPAPAAVPPVPVAPTAGHLMGTGQGFVPPAPTAGHLMGAGQPFAAPVPVAAPPVTAAPVTPAPPPAIPAPAAAAVTPAVAPDPYAGFPPEVAALLRANDQQTAAQQSSLRGYFDQQAGAAQTFATAIGQQTGNLANLAGIPVGATNQATAGLGGPVAALPGALGQISTQLGAAQGLGTTNAAAVMPGFLRQAGAEAGATFAGAGAKARGGIIENYVEQQGELARTQAEQQGLDARAVAQIESSERVAAAQQATSQVNNLLDFISSMAQQAAQSGDKAKSLQFQNMWKQLSAQTTMRGQDVQAQTTQRGQDLTSQTRLATTGATAARQSGRDYTKLRTDLAKTAATDILGQQAPQVSVTTGSGANRTTQRGWYKPDGSFTTEPQYTGGREPADVMQGLISQGLKPVDAYNIANSAARRAGVWTQREADVYATLLEVGYTPMQARTLTKRFTGRDPIAGPPAPKRKKR